MFDIPIREVMERRKVLKIAPDATVAKAAKLMAKRNSGAVMVLQRDRLVGIFTERDIVFRVVAPGLDPDATRVIDVMTPAPRTIGPNHRFGLALAVMHKNRFRHLPVLEGDKLVGILSARSAMDADLEDFVSEAQRRQHFMTAPELG